MKVTIENKIMEDKENNEKPKDAKAPPTRQKIKTKTVKTSLPKVPTPPREEESEEEEAVATHLGGGDLLTGHFIMTNLSLDEDN